MQLQSPVRQTSYVNMLIAFCHCLIFEGEENQLSNFPACQLRILGGEEMIILTGGSHVSVVALHIRSPSVQPHTHRAYLSLYSLLKPAWLM